MNAGSKRSWDLSVRLPASVVMAVLVSVAIHTSVRAQDTTDSDEDAASESGTAAAADIGDIDAMLLQDEEALFTDENTLYEADGRRDPFRSLLLRAQAEPSEQARPDGIPGLLIDELHLEGLFVTPEGPVAQVQAASDQVSYLLRPGDELWDGDVVDVSIKEIVFKQKVDDLTALKPFREVVMRLYNEP